MFYECKCECTVARVLKSMSGQWACQVMVFSEHTSQSEFFYPPQPSGRVAAEKDKIVLTVIMSIGLYDRINELFFAHSQFLKY